MFYCFPKMTNYPGDKEQMQKIGEEYKEFLEADKCGSGGHHQIIECLDIIHACETWLRHQADTEYMLDDAVDEVIAKNKVRGYYD